MTGKQQGAAAQTASAAEVERAVIDPDDFTEAVISVKGCAAALTAMYVQDAGELRYSPELFEMLAHQLHGAARYFDTVLETL